MLCLSKNSDGVANCRRVGTAVQAIATLVLSDKPKNRTTGSRGIECLASNAPASAWVQAQDPHWSTGVYFTVQHSLQLGKLADAEKILIEAQSRLDGTEFCIETASIREQRILFEDSISFSVRNGLKLGSGGRSLG